MDGRVGNDTPRRAPQILNAGTGEAARANDRDGAGAAVRDACAALGRIHPRRSAIGHATLALAAARERTGRQLH